MQNLADVISVYVRETRKLESLPSSTETSFYPDPKTLLNAVLKSKRLPLDVITGTSEGGAHRRDMPDFVLGDSSLFVGVYGEVKRADTTLADLAVSTEQNDQVGRYLSQTGVVLICNVRGLGLLTCDPTAAGAMRGHFFGFVHAQCRSACFADNGLPVPGAATGGRPRSVSSAVIRRADMPSLN
jgi:hypothetical protein